MLTESVVHDGMSYGARTVTDYDRHGRVAAVRVSAGDGAEVSAATYGYDGTGRLWKTVVPGLETVRGYNVRGNLTSIQSPVYEETLRYEDGVMTPTVTGRISERDFRLYGDLWRSYYYSYDGIGRMASAQSRDESAHSWGRLALNREFDLNGNITKILRQGAIARGVYGVTDDAALEYDGNQLRGVTENAPGVNLETSADIPPGDFGEDSFGYDANGNMTSDDTRGIADIVYSAANRPLRITMADGRKIDYVYDADGVKLEATEPFKALTGTELRAVRVERPTLPVLMSRRYYRGGFEFRDGSMSRYNVGPGYFGYDGTYYSNITDYQGNVVAVTSADSAGGFTIHQLNAYYPDGQPVAAEALVNGGARPVVKVFEDNRYKFGAKELTTTYGADFYDFEARMLGTGIPAFMSIDPKAIDYQGVSPYVFCMGDPVNYVDPSGEDVFTYDAAGNLLERLQDDAIDIVIIMHYDEGGLQTKIETFADGTIENIDTSGFVKDPSNAFDSMAINGEGGRDLYKAFADMRVAEFILFEGVDANGDEISFINTSHKASDSSGTISFVRNVANPRGVTLQTMTHNHPSNSDIPSPGDVDLWNGIQDCFPQMKLLQSIYTKDNGFRPYPNISYEYYWKMTGQFSEWLK